VRVRVRVGEKNRMTERGGENELGSGLRGCGRRVG
jgi:hypothetical protein